jgi:molybdopterin molybdotransferase
MSYLDGKLYVSRSGIDEPSSVSSLVEANALIVLPGGTSGYEKGMIVGFYY